MEDNKDLTEAEMQIERLKRLKEEKDRKYQKMKDEAMPYLPVKIAALKSAGIPAKKRAVGTIKIDKNTFEKVHRVVVKISASNPAAKIGKERFVNIVLKELLKYEAVFYDAKNADDIKNLLSKMTQK